jgi:hypothetical protein
MMMQMEGLVSYHNGLILQYFMTLCQGFFHFAGVNLQNY